MKGPAIDVIVVPYDSGRRGWRMGGGPLALIERGLIDRLRALGLAARAVPIELAPGATVDQAAAYVLAADIENAVRHARTHRRLPLILAGNCNSALGTLAGMNAATTGVVWFDAHGDFNTPETSPSGFLDGMSLATLTGRCNTEASGRIPNFRAVPEEAVVLVGARDLDDEERSMLEGSAVRVVAVGAATAEAVAAAVESWPEDAVEAYVHVDLDVLDAAEATVNEYAAPGGLTLSDLLSCIDAISAHAPIGAAAITAVDPAADPEGRALAAAVTVIEQIVTRAEAGGPA